MDIRQGEIEELLEFFSKNTYNAWDTHPKVQNVMQRCLDLFALDYTYSVVSNSNGELSTNYPSSLVVLEGDKHAVDVNGEAPVPSDHNLASSSSSSSSTSGGPAKTNGHSHTDSYSVPSTSSSVTGSTYDGINPELPKIKDLCSKARYARCRARFPVPVILYNNKHICRSATLSGGPEIYGRASFDYFFSGGSGADTKSGEAEIPEDDVIVPDSDVQGGDWQLFDRVRNQDIRLLKAFQVHTIVDLMVEKKKVKFGVYVTSSEKVDKKDRYRDFTLISLPYPGCEFFKQYRDNNYKAEELMFEWNQGHVDAEIFVPPDVSTDALNLEWSQYRKWDLIRLTQNYLKLLLAYLKGNHRGMLIHCISGWDRTPLFVSLLRLSLWADGVIHKSLNAEQILYLTLAYDWLLFGHNLEDRLNKGEEILFFCFYFLMHIVDGEFSVAPEDELSVKSQNGCLDCSTSPAQPNKCDIPCTSSGALVETPERSVNGTDAQGNHENPLSSTHINGKLGNHHVSNCVNAPENHPVDDPIGAQFPLEVGSSPADAVSHCGMPSDDTKSQLPDTHSFTNPSVQSQANLAENAPRLNGSSLSLSNIPDANCKSETSENQVDVPPPSLPPVDCSDPLTSVMANGDGESHGPDSTVNGIIAGRDCGTALSEEISKSTSSSVPAEVSAVPSVYQNSTSLGEVEGGIAGVDEPKPNVVVSPPVRGTRRCERLQIVRTLFHTLYDNAIGLQPRHTVGDTNSSSGLSVIIDNIATKVGIRVANRSTS